MTDLIERLRAAIAVAGPDATDGQWATLLAEAMNAADEIAALRERVEALEGALRKIAENDSDGLHSYTPQAMQSIARAILAQHGGEVG